MEEDITNKIMNILREESDPENYVFDFISNYYLSRKLKSMSIEQVLKKFKNNDVKDVLTNVYEGNKKSISKFSYFKDFSIGEMTYIIEVLFRNMGLSNMPTNVAVKSIIQLSLELLDLEKEDTLFELGLGAGVSLLNGSTKSKVAGIETNTKYYIVSCLLLELFDVSIDSLINEDILSYDLSSSDANKFFMNMPIRTALSQSKLEKLLELKFKNSFYKDYISKNDLQWIFALDVVENTDYEKLVMVVNGNPLYSETNKEIRNILINDGKIEAVIALPNNLLAYTSISQYLVIFSHNNEKVKFVDASKLYSSKKFKNTIDESHIENIVSSLEEESEISKFVDINSLEKEDYILDPLRYTMPDFPFENSIELKEVVKSIKRGFTIKRSDLDDMISRKPTNYQYLMSQNFQDGIIDSNLPYLKELGDDYSRFFLKDNSVIVSRLAPFKIGTVDELKTNVLVNGNLFFLEVDESKINKDFLTAYLQSRIGIREMEKYAKGSAMKTISMRDFEKVKIPKLSMEKQNELAKKFRLLNLEFKSIKKRAKDIENERLNMFEGNIS